MIVALGDIYAQLAHLQEARELMRRTQALVREQPGCLSYTFAETLDDPGHFLVVEQWRDRAALDEHYRSQAFAEYQREVEDLLVRSSDLQLHAVQESFRPIPSSPGDPRLDD